VWAPGVWPERHKASIRPYAAREEETSDRVAGRSESPKVQGYYKRNRHFQLYVVSKPLA